jgi:TPR repeat protein
MFALYPNCIRVIDPRTALVMVLGVAFVMALAAVLQFRGAQAAPPPPGLDHVRAFAKDLLVREEYADAIAASLFIAQQAPQDARAQYEYAGTLGFLRMFTEAVPAIERAIMLDPNNTLYWEFAAMALQQISQHDKAFAATERGAELGDVNAMFSLAGLHEHGRGTSVSKEKALQWLERAASAGHLSAMDVMRRVYAEGLYEQAPNSARAAQWAERLHRETNR